MSDIITASGLTFKSDYFVVMDAQGLLFLRVLGVDENTVRSVFGDQNETSCLRNGSKFAFGFVNLKMILKEGTAFKVVLSK